MNAVHIRGADPVDAQSLLAIYAPFVTDTAVSFETTPPTPEEFARRVAKAVDGWAWLVATIDGQCVGYAYASAHREREAYRFSVETSAYVIPGLHRRGIGGELYATLFDALARRSYRNAYAGIALPNEASIALHRKAGFEPVGVFRAVGWKFDRSHDVAWWQRRIESPRLM